MSLPSQLGSFWIRARMKRKPAGERELVAFTRQVFRPPSWLIGLHSCGVKIERAEHSVKGEWIVPPDAPDKQPVIYYLHGGGYISGSAKTNRPITVTLARRLKSRVFALDYRLAPEHRFPAAVEDALAGYRWLISLGIDSHRISVAGDSAGGGLALALVMRLRDLGESLPACVACLSPWTDMTGRGNSIIANSERDPMFCAQDIGRYVGVYLGSQSREDPLASPLLGDFTSLPPLLIHVGETECLLDDARQAHKKMFAAGRSSQLRIFEGVAHGWQFGTPFVPEARESLREISQFIERHWLAPNPLDAPRTEVNKYSGKMTLREARSLFFARSGLGADGGYGARWVRIETKPVPVYFPNTACRVEAAKLHDLHHIAMEYETDWLGEAEIAGWEIASGCGRHGWAWLLNLGAFTVGMVMFPRRLFRAFVRGRRAHNLYREGFPEARLSEKTVEWLRSRLGITNEATPINAADRMAFAFWCAVALAYHVALPVAGLVVLSWLVLYR